ncbi:MAG: hypothetical protein ACRYGP_16945 [Janthinobacterium lividum]
MDTLDNSAFHAAHLAAPELDPERLRLAIDAYLADLHVTVTRITDGRALTLAEAENAFRPRDVES